MTCGTTSLTEQERQGGHWKKWHATLGFLPGNELFRLFGESFRNSFEIHVKRRGSRDESYAVHGHGYREPAAGPAVSDARTIARTPNDRGGLDAQSGSTVGRRGPRSR